MVRVTGSGVEDLHLDAVSKRFGDALAVDRLTLDVPGGSFFALLGPSGCGKTTTLRMVAGLELPTSGRILLGARDITRQPPYRRRVNTVFQSYALFPHLDVFDNVAFGLRRRGVRAVDGPVAEMLALVELTGLAGRRPAQLSGGQQQRVALARALINRPDVLLLDEPLGALDLKLRRQMQLELKRIQTEVGITFIHVTHDQEEALTMADTVAVMNAGRIEQMGSPIDVYEAPQTAFVANFLGQANLYKGTIEGPAEPAPGADPAVAVRLDDGVVRVPAAGLGRRTGAVIVGVRPEKIRVVDAAASGALPPNRLAGTIAEVAFVGVSTQYVIALGSGLRLSAFEQNLDPREVGQPGEEVSLGWEPRHTFLLDPDEDLTAGVEPDLLALAEAGSAADGG